MATKYITVSIDIMHDKNLNQSQKLILAEIEQLSQLDNGCFASNKHFSDLIGITKENVSRNINELERIGYIAIDIKKGTRNHTRIITLINLVRPPYQNSKTPLLKQQETKGIEQTNITNNIKNNKKENTISYSFDDYWALVPNKKNKGQARSSFEKQLKKCILPDFEVLKKAMIYEHIKTLFEFKFQQNPSTWLNSENWDKEYTADELYKEISSMYNDFEIKMQIKNKINSIFMEYGL